MLTPLDARNSLLLERPKSDGSTTFAVSETVQDVKQPLARNASPDRYMSAEPANPYAANAYARPETPSYPVDDQNHEKPLLGGAAPMSGREPTVPNMGGYDDRGYGGYPPNNGYQYR